MTNCRDKKPEEASVKHEVPRGIESLKKDQYWNLRKDYSSSGDLLLIRDTLLTSEFQYPRHTLYDNLKIGLKSQNIYIISPVLINILFFFFMYIHEPFNNDEQPPGMPSTAASSSRKFACCRRSPPNI